MSIVSRARALRKLIERLAKNLTDEEALENTELFPQWETDHAYEVDDRVRYEDVLYKVLLAHVSQSTWTPDVSPSLFVRVDDPGEEWPEWRQPTGATDAYMQGDKVSHNGKHWVSLIDNNIWEPSVYGWEERA